ncbi:hypothetical protein ANCCEY_13948 [Ancylostoma ceylanicum]|uniref:FAD-binding domain-containing protein n=1 Tax=Ancylostoma ceylanicum TaxID=53326 RepID=A0A0D6LH37_9BILA|nr:hypothetical protein ANCCEY_13948 [Ancylostoma ceylanicum]
MFESEASRSNFQHIVSINRRHLNEVMITQAEKSSKVKFFFEHKVRSVDLDKKELIVTFTKEADIRVKGDLVIACDGAYSAVRRSLATQPRFDYSQEYIEHGYIELNILPKNGEGFEDCLVLSEALDACNDDIPKALSLYSESRVKDAHTIIDLAMYNYEELKDLVNHRSYKLRKKLDLFLNRIFSNRWLPLYSMVTFTRMPYHEIVEERKRQDKVAILELRGFSGLK